MKTINYETGRNYGKPQILAITIENEIEGDFGTDVYVVFRDSSRNISGRVSVVMFPGDSLGKQVLSAYDAGRYSLI